MLVANKALMKSHERLDVSKMNKKIRQPPDSTFGAPNRKQQ